MVKFLTPTEQEIRKYARKTLREVGMPEPGYTMQLILNQKGLSYFNGNEKLKYRKEILTSLKVEPIEHFRGIIHLGQKIILGMPQHKIQERFIQGHEIAHYVLPWHREILYQESEFTLRWDVRKEFEKEANFFAADLNFLCGRFEEEFVKNYDLKMKNIIKHREVYKASIESAARRIVEMERRPCALLYLHPIEGRNGKRTAELLYSIESEAFRTQFGYVNWTGFFPESHEATTVLNQYPQKSSKRHLFESQLKQDGKRIKVLCDCFFTNYKILVLIKPMSKLYR